MKSNTNKKITIFITLGMIFALTPTIIYIFNFNTGISENSTGYNVDYNLDNKNLKISAVSGKIHIDNNWTAAKAAGVCTGNGIYSDPYVMEDLVIDGGGSGSCILIENSDVYLRIENCTVYNSGPSYFYSGIQLSNVKNSLLIRNHCSSNYYGIYLDDGVNNTISGNTAINNIHGITLEKSDDNTVSGNTAINNNVGIVLFSSYYNTISENNANNNIYGISLFNSDYNTVSGNTANNNSLKGINLNLSDDNIISFNTITHNSVGIWLLESKSNEISNNLFSDNGVDIKNETEEFILMIVNIIVISTVIITIVVTGILIRKRRRSKGEVAKFHRLKEQEKDGVELNDKKKSEINDLHPKRREGEDFGENKMKSNAKSEIIMVFTLGILFAISPITSAIFNSIFNYNSVISNIALIIFLSIATVVIVITSLTGELITKRSYPREDEKYQLPIYGISAVVVESAGVLLFILSAIFAIFLLPAVFLTSLFWRLILLPFAVGGIIISRVGLKKDITKNLAGLGTGFGILLLILYAQLIWLNKLFVVTIIIVIAAVVIGIFLVGAFLNQKKKNKRIPR